MQSPAATASNIENPAIHEAAAAVGEQRQQPLPQGGTHSRNAAQSLRSVDKAAAAELHNIKLPSITTGQQHTIPDWCPMSERGGNGAQQWCMGRRPHRGPGGCVTIGGKLAPTTSSADKGPDERHELA